MMRRLLAVLFLGAVSTWAQVSAFQVGGRTIASQYALWQAYSTNPIGSGTQTVTMDRCYVTAGQTSGRQFVPWATNVALTFTDSNSETVMPTAVSTPATGATTCTVTAMFLHPHAQNALVTSGDGGLGEAVNDTKLAGGMVTIDPAFTGTTATILGLTGGSANVDLEDIRSGNWQLYDWTGTAYGPASTVHGLSFILPTPAVSDTGNYQYEFQADAQIQQIDCSTDVGTVGINFDFRALASSNISGAQALPSTLVCDANGESNTQFAISQVNANQWLSLDVVSISGVPGVVRIQVKYQ